MKVSPWVARWASHIAPHGRALDLACGDGRHARFLARCGHRVTAVDVDLSRAAAFRAEPAIEWVQADLEGAAWPLPGQTFQAIVVTNYLHRPLSDALLESLAPGGVLIYETFALGQARYGRPRNPQHLLLPGELLEMARGRLRILAYEDLDEPEQARCMQRLCGVSPG